MDEHPSVNAGESSGDLLGDPMESSTGRCLQPVTGDDDVEMVDQTRIWTAPDSSFSKRVTKPGTGFRAPNDGAVCQVTIKVLEKSPGDSHVDIGYPEREDVQIILGNGSGRYSEVLDACLETMHKGEECELHVLCEKGAQCNMLEQPKPECGFVEGEGSAQSVVASLCITLHDFTRNKDIFEMSVEEVLSRVSQLKSIGTNCFKEGKLSLAERFYIRALRFIISVCHPKDVKDLDENEKQQFLELRSACSLNVAACQLKGKRYHDVIIHCSRALEDNPSNIKALYRRCQAYLALDELENAKADIQKGLSSEPKNKLFMEQHRLLLKREKQVYSKLSVAMTKMFGGGS